MAQPPNDLRNLVAGAAEPAAAHGLPSVESRELLAGRAGSGAPPDAPRAGHLDEAGGENRGRYPTKRLAVFGSGRQDRGVSLEALRSAGKA